MSTNPRTTISRSSSRSSFQPPSPRAERQPRASSLLASALPCFSRRNLAGNCCSLNGKVLQLRARLELLPQPDWLRPSPGPRVAFLVAILDGDLSTLHRTSATPPCGTYLAAEH